MKQTKIYCDLCGKEMAKEYNNTFGDINVAIMTDEWVTDNVSSSIEREREILRFKSDDICEECANKIYDFINKLKKQ